TYQRNTWLALLLPQQDLGHDVLPHGVVEIEVAADDQAGDQHDDGALDHLVLGRPLDLLQLGPGLRDEVRAAPLLGLRWARLGARAHRALTLALRAPGCPPVR